IATTGANVTSFTDTGLAQVTTYWYRVRAVDASGHSTPSNAASATTTAVVVVTPTNLSGSANGTTNQITLTWMDNATNDTGTRVLRSTDGATWFQLTTLTNRTGPGTMTYVDPTASPGTTYYYTVQAFNAFTSSAQSNVATAMTVTVAPSNLVATTSSNT